MSRLTRTGGREATKGVVPGRVALSVGRPPLPEPDGFRWTLLADVARLESGHTPSRSVPRYWDGDIPWIGIRDATGNHGRVIFDTAEHITQAGIENSSARILPSGTICLSRTASVGFVIETGRPMATSQDFVNWVCGPILNGRYLRYILQLEQESVRRFAHGTTHQTMYYPEAKALHVLIPQRRDQNAIVEVLGALDDKVAVNSRQVQLIQELTDATFERAAHKTSGDIATFDEVADVGGGGTPRTSVDGYWGGGIPWATPTDVTGISAPYLRSTARTITDAGLAACASDRYPSGSILMTSRATIGAFAIAQVPIAVNQGFIVVNARNRELQWWLFHDMKSRVQEFMSYANGATFLELPRGRFKSLLIKLPDAHTAREFNAAVRPLHASAAGLAQENERLAAARDELLPLLMSGKVRVRDAERAVGEVL
jgi:type I restriction enzyme S subunit